MPRVQPAAVDSEEVAVYRPYTGVGSRRSPLEIMVLLSQVGGALAELGWTLRSGGAGGADQAFETLVPDSLKEIYLPWRGFNGSASHLYQIAPKAFEIAAEYHPGWKHLKFPARKLMARNVHQVLGQNLDTPSKFLICWTPDGCESRAERTRNTGGTGQAIAIASDHGIPVFNLQRPDHISRVLAMIELTTTKS